MKALFFFFFFYGIADPISAPAPLQINKQIDFDLVECTNNYFFNLQILKRVRSPFKLAIDYIQGDFEIQAFQVEKEQILNNPENWLTQAIQLKTQSNPNEFFLQNANLPYFSLRVINKKCQEKMNAKFKILSAHKILKISKDEISVKLDAKTWVFASVQDKCNISKYLTISAVDRANPRAKFNFYLGSQSGPLPRDSVNMMESLWSNHLQTTQVNSTCSWFLSIQNPSSEPAEIEINIEDFTFSTEQSFISSTGQKQVFQQSSDLQTYIFYNWSKEKEFSVHLETDRQATLFLNFAHSEQQAKSMTDLEDRPKSISQINTGGASKILLGPQYPDTYCGFCYYIFEVRKESEYPIINLSFQVLYEHSIEKIKTNQVVRRRLQGGRQWFLFQIEIESDLKITARNIANDAEFIVFEDCRGKDESKPISNVYAEGSMKDFAIFSKDNPNFQVGKSYCLEVRSQAKNVITVVQIQTVNIGYSVLTSGQSVTLHFAVRSKEFKRYIVTPIGSPDHFHATEDEITASIFIQDRNSDLTVGQRRKTEYCLRVSTGFVDLKEIEKGANLDDLASEEYEEYCSNNSFWKTLKLIEQRVKVEDFSHLGILVVSELIIPKSSKASQEQYEFLGFGIVVSLNSIISLNANQEYGDELSEGSNPYDLYKLHLSGSAKIQVEPCFGDIELQVYDSFKSLKSGQLSARITELEQGKISFDLREPVPSPEVFFKVSLLQSKKGPQTATYRIRTKMATTFFRIYYPKEHGKITVKSAIEQTAELEWGALMMVSDSLHVKDKMVPDKDVRYAVFLSQSPDYNLESICTLHLYTKLMAEQIQQRSIKITLPDIIKIPEKEEIPQAWMYESECI